MKASSRFGTRMSALVVLLTLSLHVLVLFGCLLPVLSGRLGGMPGLLSVAFPVLIFGLVFILRPYCYDLEDTELVVRKLWLPKRVSFADIESVNPVVYADLKITIRLWASGGFWGWFGIFQSSRYGRINMQCTELKQLVLIRLRNGVHLVLSPRDSTSFIAALRTATEHAVNGY